MLSNVFSNISIEAPTPEEMTPRQQGRPAQLSLADVNDARVNEIEDRMDAFYEEMKILKQAIQVKKESLLVAIIDVVSEMSVQKCPCSPA